MQLSLSTLFHTLGSPRELVPGISNRKLFGTWGETWGDASGWRCPGVSKGCRCGRIRYDSLEINRWGTTKGRHWEVSEPQRSWESAVGILGCSFSFGPGHFDATIFGEIILDFQKSCKDNTESSCTPLTQFALILTLYITICWGRSTRCHGWFDPQVDPGHWRFPTPSCGRWNVLSTFPPCSQKLPKDTALK